MQRLFLSTLSVMTMLVIACSTALADFTMVNPFFRHSSTASAGSDGVVILPEKNQHGISGLFFYHSQAALPAQGFSIDQLPSGSDSLFLGFNNEGSRKFNELIVSSGKRYTISGNLTVRIGNLRITVHDENQAEQYVSVVSDNDQGALGFIGLQLVLSPSAKSKALKYIQPKGADTIDTFQVKNGQLILNNHQFNEPKVGLGFGGGGNPCVSNGVQVLTRAQYQSIQKGEKKLSSVRKNFYAKNTLLFSQSDHVIAIDGYGQLVVVKPEAERLNDGSLICIADSIREGI